MVDQIELVELLKLINKSKTKLAIGRDRMYALRDEQGTIMHNVDKIIKIAKRFYTKPYASDVGPGETTEPTSFACDVPPVTKEEVEKALKGMKRAKAAGDDCITIYLIKEREHIILEKLAKLFSEFLRTLKVPKAWKNGHRVRNKADNKYLKSYRPISLLSVVYKLFTMTVVSRITTSPGNMLGLEKDTLQWITSMS